jgi:hypothetical protein
MNGIGDVERAAAQLVEHRLAEGLRRNRPRVNRDPSHALATLHHGYSPAQLRRLDGRLLAARARAYDQHIKIDDATVSPAAPRRLAQELLLSRRVACHP